MHYEVGIPDILQDRLPANQNSMIGVIYKLIWQYLRWITQAYYDQIKKKFQHIKLDIKST